MIKKYFSLIIFFILVSSFYFFLKKETRSEIVYFYPQTCLGSFINPEKVQGEAEIDSFDLINESNSAVYLGGFKEIYCGNFQGAVKEAEIKNINLKFNMLLTNDRKEAPIVELISSETLIEKILPPKTIEIINNSSENTTPATPITSVITTGEILSYFDIFYTLEGQNWEYLGSITSQNWQNVEFAIPINDWLIIPKIQIKIQSSPLLDDIPYLYLESMMFEIELTKNVLPDDFQIVHNQVEEIDNFNIADFKILKIRGIEENLVIISAQKDEKKFIFIINLFQNKIFKLDLDIKDYIFDSPLGSKDNFVFWLGENNKIYAFDYKDFKLFVGNLKSFSPSKGERVEMKLNKLNFDIIFDGNDFYFRNEKFGEIFSDENSLGLEKFRKNFKLDQILTKEELSSLGFNIE